MQENRNLRKVESDSERELGADDRAAAAAREHTIKGEERQERMDERAAKDARLNKISQKRREEWAHKITMLQMQLELSRNSKREGNHQGRFSFVNLSYMSVRRCIVHVGRVLDCFCLL